MFSTADGAFVIRASEIAALTPNGENSCYIHQRGIKDPFILNQPLFYVFDEIKNFYHGAEAKVEELESCLREAIDLMEDIREGNYKPDSFTTQPWHTVLEKTGGKND